MALVKSLMSAMIDMADRWLQLSRLSLIVWTSNERAISLYKRFGFVIEGTMPRYVFLDGDFGDAHLMGRISNE